MEMHTENKQLPHLTLIGGLDHTAAQVDAPTLNEWMQDGTVFLIDVRESDDFEKSRIPGAFLVPMSRFDAATFPRVSNMKTVLVCQRGRRAHAVGDRLVSEGFEDVYYLSGGIKSWLSTGLETED